MGVTVGEFGFAWMPEEPRSGGGEARGATSTRFQLRLVTLSGEHREHRGLGLRTPDRWWQDDAGFEARCQSLRLGTNRSPVETVLPRSSPSIEAG